MRKPESIYLYNFNRLGYEDFKKWILGHKNLYTNYYDGFHP
jgi:hypothetical protein